MSDFAFDREMAPPPPEPRRRNANLGTADAEEIFASFDTRIVRRFSAFLKPHPWSVIGSVAAAVASAIAQLLMPIMIGVVVTVATSGRGDGRWLDLAVLAFFGAVIAFTATSILSQWLSTKLAQKVIFDLRRAMFDHFQS